METPTRKRMTGQLRRQQLLEQSKCLFGRLGYRDASTSQLAKQSGVSEPVLYNHFDNKKHLFISTLQEFARHNETLLREAMLSEGHTRAVDALATVLVHYRRIVAADPDIQKMIFDGFSEARDPEIAEAVRHNFDRFRSYILQLLELAQQQGDIAPSIDLQTASLAFTGVMCTTQALLMLGNDNQIDEARIRDFTRLWLRALASNT